MTARWPATHAFPPLLVVLWLNAPVLGQPVAGLCLQFDGTRETRATINNHSINAGGPTLNPGICATIECWLRPNSLPVPPGNGGVVEQRFINKGDGIACATARTFEFKMGADGHAGFQSDFFTGACPGWTTLSAPYATSPGQWLHLAAVYNGIDGYSEIYYNGQRVARTRLATGGPISMQLLATDAPLLLGGWYRTSGFDTSRPYTGELDEARVWSIARSPTQLASEYRLRVDPRQPGLLGDWRFDESQGQVLIDAGLHGHNGVLGTTTSTEITDPVRVTSTVPLLVQAPCSPQVDPVILMQPRPALPPTGCPATLEVAAVGSGTVRYQWFRNGQPLRDENGVSGSATPRLAVASVTEGSHVMVVVTDECGIAISATVAMRPRFPDDLSDFVTCFFAQVLFPGLCADADFNADGNVDPDDLADFITAFFTGC